jgi:solute carrier family 25 uncoupling protein 8/9
MSTTTTTKSDINSSLTTTKALTTTTSSSQAFGRRFPVLAGFAASSTSVATATFLTNGIDVVKIRQQLAGNSSRNMFATGAAVVREEGVLALYKGVVPAVARGIVYGGLRIGLYPIIKDALGADAGQSDIFKKVAAGMTAGSIAAGICNPTDLVKTRMQTKGGSNGKGPLSVAAMVYRQDGIQGLWKGTTPSMARAALLTASQCATYDEVKLLFVRNLGWDDNLGTHLMVSGIAGLVTTTITAPVDMIKTNMFVHSHYSGPMQCFADIWERQGMRGLFKGWGGNWMRQGPMTTVIFVVYEKLRPLMGLDQM